MGDNDGWFANAARPKVVNGAGSDNSVPPEALKRCIAISVAGEVVGGQCRRKQAETAGQNIGTR